MPKPASNLTRALIRISAFLLKEIFEIARQPMLLVVLVLGPFLILLFFGAGFRGQARAMRTLFVVDENSPLVETVEKQATSLGPQLIYAGLSHNALEAQQRLNSDEVDVVVVIPSDPYTSVLNNQQAIFEVYHHELDPLQADYIRVFGQVYADEVNRRVLRFITSAGKLDLSGAQQKLDIVAHSITTFKEALQKCSKAATELENVEACDTTTLNQHVQTLDQKLDEFQLELDRRALLSDALEQQLKPATRPHFDLQSQLDEMIRHANELGGVEKVGEQAEVYLTQLQTLTNLENDVALLQTRLAEFLTLEPRILISPFRSQAHNLATVPITIIAFFTPAVIVLLLQHLTVTFAALSLVRERQVGALELFRVAPLSPLETLLGKYLSYLIFGLALALILLLIMVFGLGIPFLGHVFSVALALTGLLFASLGIGFIISLVSDTDTQAVQYAMLVLLVSVFFSGFILDLGMFWPFIGLISRLIPATYGTLALRDLMLRGASLDWLLLAQLMGYGLLLFGVAWYLLKRAMTKISG